MTDQEQSALENLRKVLSSYDEISTAYSALPEEDQQGTNYERYEDGLLSCVEEFAWWTRKLLEGEDL